eukprot:TRINITY_DN1356_c0_g1_i1.p1 TRINITY_DN1356_c0_g1~~TRINITY_DN1356_c0_g1_i1.p1  ORF type:complete len:306 (+),score=27.04 TRINITY_DN1356_c0_g1_i1:378-1295(+)
MENRTSSNPHATQQTASDASIIEVVHYAQSVGLDSILIKPHVDLIDGASRFLISPDNATAFFEAYKSIVVHYATLAHDLNVTRFCVGTELGFLSIPQYLQYWTAVIADIREACPSCLLTYAAFEDEYLSVSFWDQLDIIGIDFYYSLVSDSDSTTTMSDRRSRATSATAPTTVAALSKDARSTFTYSVSEMVDSISREITAIRHWMDLHSYAHMPLAFTEVGYGSFEGAPLSPSLYPSSCSEVRVNDTVQAMAYSALLTNIEMHNITAAYLWWLDNSSTGDMYPGGELWACGYTPRGKAAWDVLA